MSRRAVDPIEKVFDQWARLTPEQRQQFGWQVRGFQEVERRTIAVPKEPRMRKPKEEAAKVPE